MPWSLTSPPTSNPSLLSIAAVNTWAHATVISPSKGVYCIHSVPLLSFCPLHLNDFQNETDHIVSQNSPPTPHTDSIVPIISDKVGSELADVFLYNLILNYAPLTFCSSGTLVPFPCFKPFPTASGPLHSCSFSLECCSLHFHSPTSANTSDLSSLSLTLPTCYISHSWSQSTRYLSYITIIIIELFVYFVVIYYPLLSPLGCQLNEQ